MIRQAGERHVDIRRGGGGVFAQDAQPLTKVDDLPDVSRPGVCGQ